MTSHSYSFGKPKLSASSFVGWVIYMSIHLTTDSADTAAFWGLLVFFLLFLVPTDRLNDETFLKIIKAARGIKDERE